ncbi:MarR family transcriptional regulator [Helicobacter sp. MIT 99-10781]|uniref:MarR family winged helix-turn-helix transcriptional regulator n=1 Tax=Helicobacter sp. MIT 99-10781 TaxID=1332285 RepID=UPI000E1FFCB7|nr:MarR family winged helix-turn-helix transcriptional regulator [Helicobacter sp. MIT 99-10781]RDU57719.1 MarR family transcriptional regulator [Helicobacter sp. MIT 99-10781]
MCPNIQECVGFLATSICKILSSEFDKQLEEFGITHKQAGILWKCFDTPTSQTHLCDIANADKNYVRFFIDDLEAKGLVTRVKNPQNRRENMIHLTESGKELALKTYEMLLRFQEGALLEHISESEYESIKGILQKIYLGLYKN